MKIPSPIIIGRDYLVTREICHRIANTRRSDRVARNLGFPPQHKGTIGRETIYSHFRG